MREEVKLWLSHAKHGFCGVTKGPGDCAKDDQGAVALPKPARKSLPRSRANESITMHEAAAHCLKSPETIVQGTQLQAFSLLALGDEKSALSAFSKSVRMGNETDWQMVVELGVAHHGVGSTSAND